MGGRESLPVLPGASWEEWDHRKERREVKRLGWDQSGGHGGTWSVIVLSQFISEEGLARPYDFFRLCDSRVTVWGCSGEGEIRHGEGIWMQGYWHEWAREIFEKFLNFRLHLKFFYAHIGIIIILYIYVPICHAKTILGTKIYGYQLNLFFRMREKCKIFCSNGTILSMLLTKFHIIWAFTHTV